MSGVMAETSLTECLECGYDLRGLPAVHRCPERGQAYDAATRVWRLRSRRRTYGLPVVMLTLTLMANVGAVVRIALGGSRRMLDFVAALLVAANVAIYAWVFRRLARTTRFVAVSSEALHVRTWMKTQVVRWEEVQDMGGFTSRGVYVRHRAKEELETMNISFDSESDKCAFLWAARGAMGRTVVEGRGGEGG